MLSSALPLHHNNTRPARLSRSLRASPSLCVSAAPLSPSAGPDIGTSWANAPALHTPQPSDFTTKTGRLHNIIGITVIVIVIFTLIVTVIFILTLVVTPTVEPLTV